MSLVYNRITGQEVHRISGLSDGVFAIAMTLIVLEIRLPATPEIHTDTGLLRALAALSPRLLMYLMSFLTLGIFWVGQQTQLQLLSRSDRNLAWIHFAFLSVVTLMPFSTTILAEHLILRAALLVYWLNFLLLGGTLYLAWRYTVRAGLVEAVRLAQLGAGIERRIVVAQLLYLLGLVVGLFLGTLWGIGFIVLVQLNYAFAPRIKWLYRL